MHLVRECKENKRSPGVFTQDVCGQKTAPTENLSPPLNPNTTDLKPFSLTFFWRKSTRVSMIFW